MFIPYFCGSRRTDSATYLTVAALASPYFPPSEIPAMLDEMLPLYSFQVGEILILGECSTYVIFPVCNDSNNYRHLLPASLPFASLFAHFIQNLGIY